MDWRRASALWERLGRRNRGPREAKALRKIFEIAFAKLKIREMERPQAARRSQGFPKGAQEKASNEWLGDETFLMTLLFARQSLVAVMGNLRAIYDTKFCSPGALGSLKLGCL